LIQFLNKGIDQTQSMDMREFNNYVQQFGQEKHYLLWMKTGGFTDAQKFFKESSKKSLKVVRSVVHWWQKLHKVETHLQEVEGPKGQFCFK